MRKISFHEQNKDSKGVTESKCKIEWERHKWKILKQWIDCVVFIWKEISIKVWQLRSNKRFIKIAVPKKQLRKHLKNVQSCKSVSQLSCYASRGIKGICYETSCSTISEAWKEGQIVEAWKKSNTASCSKQEYRMAFVTAIQDILYHYI